MDKYAAPKCPTFHTRAVVPNKIMKTNQADSKENISKFSWLSERIDNAVEIGTSALRKFPTEQYPIVTFTYLNLLQRFIFHLKSIGVLLKGYEKDPNLENSLGLILRAGLLDFMTTIFLSTYQMDIKNSEDHSAAEIFFEKFDSFITDHIRHTIDYLITAVNSGYISQEQYESALENTKKKYGFAFKTGELDYNKPKGQIITAKALSAKKMFNRIHEYKMTKKYSNAYDLYLYFGKYEHFGIMTHFIQQQGIQHFFEIAQTSIKYIVTGIETALVLVSQDENLLENERKELALVKNELQKK